MRRNLSGKIDIILRTGKASRMTASCRYQALGSFSAMRPHGERSEKKKASQGNASRPASQGSPSESNIQTLLSSLWLPLVLATVAFVVYWPSLKSDFVYDA